MIQFYNPHVDDFLGEPPHYRLLKRRPLKKYGYILTAALESEGVVSVCADATSSAFVPDSLFSRLPGFVRRWITRWEVRQWTKLNGLEGRVVVSPTASADDGSVLLLMSYKNAAGGLAAHRSALKTGRPVVAHLSHYFISTAEKSANLSETPNVILAGDVDLTANPYFQHFFPWYARPFLTLPFTVTERFVDRTPFEQRIAKAVATGTFHDLTLEARQWKYADYIAYSGLTTYHPVRKILHAHAVELADEIDVRVSEFRPTARKPSLWKRLSQKLSSAQTAYFAIDIVALYNQHRYVIVGEEVSGAPGLGAFEAMACGCVLIAQSGFYEGLGLRQGVHFVEHDGSLDSIRECIRSLNSDPARAAAIAAAGRAHIDANFRDGPAKAVALKRLAALSAA